MTLDNIQRVRERNTNKSIVNRLSWRTVRWWNEDWRTLKLNCLAASTCNKQCFHFWYRGLWLGSETWSWFHLAYNCCFTLSYSFGSWNAYEQQVFQPVENLSVLPEYINFKTEGRCSTACMHEILINRHTNLFQLASLLCPPGLMGTKQNRFLITLVSKEINIKLQNLKSADLACDILDAIFGELRWQGLDRLEYLFCLGAIQRWTACLCRVHLKSQIHDKGRLVSYQQKRKLLTVLPSATSAR